MLALEYDAELARQTLLERGREEGLAEGIIEGLAKGREEGLAEGIVKKAREMVKSLLTTDLPMKEIARVAGWTEEEVRKFAEAEKNS